MNLLTKFMQFIHRILGTALSILFLVWFLSGLVMIYHTFPRVSQADRISRMEYLEADALPSIHELQARIPNGESITGLTLNRSFGQDIFHIQTSKGTYDLPADSAARLPIVNEQYIKKTAALWCTSPISKIDSLYNLEQWIPFGQLKKEFPIYKFYFDDPERHELYIASKTGKVLQMTDKDSRFWAWVGAIPHWIYFTSLRQDAKRWIDVVVCLSGIGCIMCVAGIYLGVRDFRLARKRRKGISPYKKTWYKWHHIIGTFFGLFVLTFAFSGMMSLARVQDWGIRAKLPIEPNREIRNMAPAPDKYTLDYRSVIAAYPNQIRQLEWNSFGDIPFYTLQNGTENTTIQIDATDSIPRHLYLKEEQILAVIRNVHGTNSTMKTTLLDHYDTYYVSRKHRLPLPVWKIELADVDNSCYFVHPGSGQYRYVNTPARWMHWMYPALHSLSIKFLVERPILWNIVMWGFMLTGTFVSLSGVWLAWKYIMRKRPFCSDHRNN